MNKKEYKYKKQCKTCINEFFTNNNKILFCYKCKQPKICSCGCKRVILTPGVSIRKWCLNKGLTYRELYGKSNKGHFQKGVAKSSEIREKISKSMIKAYTPELRQKRREHILDRFDRGETPFSRLRMREKF